MSYCIDLVVGTTGTGAFGTTGAFGQAQPQQPQQTGTGLFGQTQPQQQTGTTGAFGGFGEHTYPLCLASFFVTFHASRTTK